MKRIVQYAFISTLLSFVFISCGQEGGSGDGLRSSSNLPKAQGQDREIYVVIDSALYAGEVGEIVRDIYAAPVPGLLKDEPWFTLRQINPLGITETLKRQQNLIFVTALDQTSRQNMEMQNFFSPQSLEAVRENPDRFMMRSEDEFARGQEIIYLFGATKSQLIANLEKNQKDLRQYMVNKTLKSIQADIRNNRDNGITKELREDRGYTLQVPKGYYIAREFENLVWLRQPDQKIDKSVFVYSIPYTDEQSFDRERIMSLRDSVTKEYLYDIDKRDLYFEVEPLVPLYTDEFSFNGRYAVESRGMWKMSDQSVGGPFVSYMFVDENTNTLYYIDGFLIAPGQDKVEDLFELEAIMSTFEVVESNEPASPAA
ncbi:DUF4837 family protein [Roseivirga sp. BDSF3-8]|uniref:DUF4837 family protein n=1 Tax=Roseivirga sp. BDSF3-8 TaxID=3241598 RepID=UPI00353217AD